MDQKQKNLKICNCLLEYLKSKSTHFVDKAYRSSGLNVIYLIKLVSVQKERNASSYKGIGVILRTVYW